MELGHIEDLAVKAAKTGCAASRFITPAEVLRVTSHFSRRQDVKLTLDGGYDNAERVRAVFVNPDWGAYTRGDLFAVLQIIPIRNKTYCIRFIADWYYMYFS